jgi:hypothetical protein
MLCVQPSCLCACRALLLCFALLCFVASDGIRYSLVARQAYHVRCELQHLQLSQHVDSMFIAELMMPADVCFQVGMV